MKSVLLSLVFLSPVLLLAADQKPAKEEKVLMLDPMVIRSVPIGSFAIDLGIKVDEATQKVDRLFITGVRENTDAEAAGLQVGDEIVKLDDTPVKGLDASLKPNAPLGRLIINRTPGAPIKLEVLVRRVQSFTLHAQRNTMPSP